MNKLIRFGVTSSCTIINNYRQILPKYCKSSLLSANYSRALWHMCSSAKHSDFLKPKVLNECCQCGCSGLLHTKGEKELVEILKLEIEEEKKLLKMKTIPEEVDGFAVTKNQAVLKFTKKNGPETIALTMNVNHTAEGDDGFEDDYPEEISSKPSFEVDIVRNGKTLNFLCSYLAHTEEETEKQKDVYEIVEISFYEGNASDETYSVSSSLLDDNLYELFLEILQEKGVTMSFADKISKIATSYEHLQYIGLLEKVQNFASVS